MYHIPPGWQDWAEMYRKHVDRYTDAQARQMRAFLREVVEQIRDRLRMTAAAGGELDTQQVYYILAHLMEWESQFARRAKELATQVVAESFREGIDQMVSMLGDVGVSLPVEVLEGLIFEGPDHQLLVEQFEASLQRYGQEAVQDMKRILAMHMAMGSSIDQAVQDMTKLSGWPHEVYWKGERLVRTEVAHAYNRAVRKSQEHLTVEHPDLWMVWHEHATGPIWGGPKNLPWPGPAVPLDDRTAPDSLRMHGQARRAGQKFCDPLHPTKCWPHPPNRPNDRATLVLARIEGDRIIGPGKGKALIGGGNE